METTTSLWAVIEGMQRRLEDEGLSDNVVEVAVVRRLAALLERPRRRQRKLACG